MARSEKKTKRRVNPFDIVIVLLILCLLATFGYRIYKGVEDKSDSKTSKYVLSFYCSENIDSLADYLESGTPIYLSANNEILGYIYDGKGSVTVSLITEGETAVDTSETDTAEGANATESGETEEITETEAEKSPYSLAEIRGKIHLSENVKVYNDGVYYSIGDVNFAKGSKLLVFTEETVFTIIVEGITQIDK